MCHSPLPPGISGAAAPPRAFAQHLLDDGEKEGRGLAGARLRAGHQVPPREDDRDRVPLDLPRVLFEWLGRFERVAVAFRVTLCL